MSLRQAVLVFGGSRGTGLLIAQRLLRDGVAVRVLARNPTEARARLGPSCEIVAGDLTQPETLPRPIEGVTHVVFTAGRRSGRPTSEKNIRDTEYLGVVNTLEAAREVGFSGRFLYMTSSGVTSRSFWAWALNIYKGNTLLWRRRAEEAIRASDVDYTVIRAGFLLNRPGGHRAILITQKDLPLSLLRYRIAREDVAETFVAA
ncbi:MAG: NAD(P)H-binding protein, partial [Gemmatimonadaceae bacterium]